jgi:hypothetical protein
MPPMPRYRDTRFLITVINRKNAFFGGFEGVFSDFVCRIRQKGAVGGGEWEAGFSRFGPGGMDLGVIGGEDLACLGWDRRRDEGGMSLLLSSRLCRHFNEADRSVHAPLASSTHVRISAQSSHENISNAVAYKREWMAYGTHGILGKELGHWPDNRGAGEVRWFRGGCVFVRMGESFCQKDEGRLGLSAFE